MKSRSKKAALENPGTKLAGSLSGGRRPKAIMFDPLSALAPERGVNGLSENSPNFVWILQ